jgi:hypothetical protein
MDLSFTPEHAAFRLEVRNWIEANFPQAIRDKQATGEHLNKEEIVSWHKILHAKGWLGEHPFLGLLPATAAFWPPSIRAAGPTRSPASSACSAIRSRSSGWASWVCCSSTPNSAG